MTKLTVKMYNIYHTMLYPRLSHLRGFTRLSEVLRKLSFRKAEAIDEKPTPITEFEWDYLIVLDSCRYDKYQKARKYDVSTRISCRGNSDEFIQKNFSAGNWSNVTYISGCSHLESKKFRALTGRNPDDTFDDVIRVYENNWNEDLGTVTAESVYEAAIENLDGAERGIVHFVQPHNPFIGDFDLGYDVAGRGSPDGEQFRNVWVLGESQKLDSDEIVKAYESNLDYVIRFVDKLVTDLDGEFLITSDHGDLLGEDGLYGHTYGSKAKKVREVPVDKIER